MVCRRSFHPILDILIKERERDKMTSSPASFNLGPPCLAELASTTLRIRYISDDGIDINIIYVKIIVMIYFSLYFVNSELSDSWGEN
jgi:hypothetical protein